MRSSLCFLLLTLAVGCVTSRPSSIETARSLPPQSTPCFAVNAESQPNIDLSQYARKVQERVQGNWHVPESLMQYRVSGWVGVSFRVQKDGVITDITMKHSSGFKDYDRSAIDALNCSSPLPSLPPEVTAPSIGGVFRFFYNMAGEGCGA